jgi:hypothetical protein
MPKKKKVNTSHLQKIEAAHQRNEFLQRLKQFCDQVAGPGVFTLIPPAQLEELYVLRNRPLRLDAADGQIISMRTLKEAKGLLVLLKNRRIRLDVGFVKEMSLYDFVTIGVTLILYADRVKESDYPNAALVKLKLSPLAAFGDSPGYHLAWADVHAIKNLIAIVLNDLSSNLYLLTQVQTGEFNGTVGMYTCLDMYIYRPEKIQFVIDGINRPAFRVGMPVSESLPLSYSSVKPELLNLKPGSALPVYVQSHALNRLSERMDGVISGFLHLYIYESFKEPNVCRNKKGEWLIEYKLLGKKTGYFVADIIDKKIILRTFLFLTNNDTPEGETLLEHTGFMKEDKAYLAIDKFSSFVHSDIKDNERIRTIFINAGCESLFEIDPSVCVQQRREHALAGFIQNYLEREQTDAFKL